MTENTQALALRAVAFSLLKDRIAAGEGLTKQDLAELMTVTDRKAVAVEFDGRVVKVGTVSFAEGKRAEFKARVEDPGAFAEWAKAENPDAVQLVPVVMPWFEQESLARAVYGEVIPGVEVVETEAGRPYISVRRDKSEDAQAALMSALFADNAVAARALLAIEPPVES